MDLSDAMEIGLVESNLVSNILNTDLDEHLVLCHNITREADQVSIVLAEVNPLLNDEHLYDTMSSASKLGKYMMKLVLPIAIIPNTLWTMNMHLMVMVLQ